MADHIAANRHISIVMITHNRCDELSRSLQHLQALPEQPAIIVVDNASTDNTVNHVRSSFPNVQLVPSRFNRGAAGRNLGVQQVRTRYVAFSDDDTWWEPDSLTMAVELLDHHPGVAVLNASIAVGPENRPDPACTAMAGSPLPHIPGIGPMLTGFMAGACVMRTEVFLKADGYWPRFLIGSEETLLAMDILDAGHHIVYAPCLRIHHWPSLRRNSSQRILLTERNAVWSAWMRLPWPMAWRQTRASLRHTAGLAQRASLLIKLLPGIPAVLANRRRLKPETWTLLNQVWEHERQPR